MPLKGRSGPFPLSNPGLLSIRAVTKCLTKSSSFRIQLARPKISGKKAAPAVADRPLTKGKNFLLEAVMVV
jgi:hypothetical protein